MTVSWIGLIVVAVVGLACLGVAVAVVLVAISAAGRGMGKSDRHDVMHCPQCRAVVSPLDRHCPSCGHALKPQEIERLDPDAR